MLTLVIGGSASGKSEYAERLTLSLAGQEPKIYLATMEPFGEEAERRIARHRAVRRDRGFETVECFRNLESLSLPAGCSLLLEDMGNLAANELFGSTGDPDGGQLQENGASDRISAAVRRILRGTDHLRAVCSRVTVVTNEVFSGGRDYAGDTECYLRVLAQVNRELAAQADRVVELHCGLPRILKGEAGAEGNRHDRSGNTFTSDYPVQAAGAPQTGETGMIFVTGPLFSGKQECIMQMLGWSEAVFAAEAVRDVQELAGQAARGARDPADLNEKLQALAESLARKRVVTATEVGGGIVPLDPVERQAREAAGRLACLLAAGAGAVIRVNCGIPQFLKGSPEDLEKLGRTSHSDGGPA